MTLDDKRMLRLQFLARVVRKECRHLESTDARLFGQPFTGERVRSLEEDPELAERVEAFVGRFGRLQDTLGDKLLPVLLTALGEKPGAVMDNLDRAERLDFLTSAEDWLAMRNLRNQMVHEYVEDPELLAGALTSGHALVPVLLAVAAAMLGEIERRGWAS
ncbi:MAG: hypothetical protein KGZ83_15245 [Sulfuricella sp.]|nr:hypothetical protein [Sulfuricella sp.]